jgi:hypothetical protein
VTLHRQIGQAAPRRAFLAVAAGEGVVGSAITGAAGVAVAANRGLAGVAGARSGGANAAIAAGLVIISSHTYPILAHLAGAAAVAVSQATIGDGRLYGRAALASASVAGQRVALIALGAEREAARRADVGRGHDGVEVHAASVDIEGREGRPLVTAQVEDQATQQVTRHLRRSRNVERSAIGCTAKQVGNQLQVRTDEIGHQGVGRVKVEAVNRSEELGEGRSEFGYSSSGLTKFFLEMPPLVRKPPELALWFGFSLASMAADWARKLPPFWTKVLIVL